jgi:hypothetical protein
MNSAARVCLTSTEIAAKYTWSTSGTAFQKKQ